MIRLLIFLLLIGVALMAVARLMAGLRADKPGDEPLEPSEFLDNKPGGDGDGDAVEKSTDEVEKNRSDSDS